MKRHRKKIDTTLLIHHHMLTGLLEHNDSLSMVDKALEDMELDGILQVAGMHPQYKFADTQPGDFEDYASLAPYPTLQLLREANITKAAAAIPGTEQIFDNNFAALCRLGHTSWDTVWLPDGTLQLDKK